MTPTVAEIAARLGGEVLGDAALAVNRIAPLDAADAASIAFVAHPKYRAQLATTGAGCVIVGPALRDEVLARGRSAIVTADPYLYYARLSQWWAERARGADARGVHPSAVVEPSARIDPTASIGALSYVGAGASIGAHTRVGVRVVVGERCTIGARCILHPGVVIGADGFGFAPHEGRWEKIEQLGAVRIGDDVEIGANTCIDRGALGDTVIEDGVKLDNLIQVGHNVHIGAHSAMAGCVGIAGSAKVGRHCTVGGGAIVLGHLELADHVHITAASVVSRSLREPGQYSGMFPIDDNASWEKNAATLRHLHALRDRLRALEKKLA
ncbi:MAG TPA: UDP-3-O-(3-hydroxymyristoyl)glucosamine N-acyltransferase [Burkholderiaceae bacterium]|nr:UDP-3-O-(3-hydroxymyristoyl)glucosamine N-acyltransferase [Burkholderiaceae bacterium]